MSSTKKGLCALLAAVALAVVAGCATTESAPDGVPLKPGQGLLAMKIISNASARLSYQEYSSETNFGSRLAENFLGPKGAISIKPGDKYWVLPADAGEYMWSKIEMGNLFANLHTSNRFRVKPNTITYIGDIRISIDNRRFRFAARDGEAAMREHLKEAYPAYLKSMEFEKVMAEMRL
ncbi:MAG TPA: hypothetical protein VK643_09805 [Burkholderiales bacterium]|jgi:hypothetical protein|nr:hypothetical protein [Burkholderiales bacterium]